MNTVQEEKLKMEASAAYRDFDNVYMECLARIWVFLWICVPLLAILLLAVSGKIADERFDDLIVFYMFFMFFAVPFVGYWAEKNLFFLIHPRYRNALNAEKR